MTCREGAHPRVAHWRLCPTRSVVSVVQQSGAKDGRFLVSKPEETAVSARGQTSRSSEMRAWLVSSEETRG